MFRKNYYLIILAIALFLAGNLTAFAQTAQTVQISGKVELKKADGTTEPVVGAIIEVYRVDKKEKFEPVKTDASGIYSVPNIPNEGEYIVSVGGEKLKATVSDIVKFGAKDVNFVLESGDGSRYSEQQIRDALANTGETAEQRKKREEIEAKNKNIQAETEVINKALTEGVKAFTDKNYDLAITRFEEGYQVNKEYIGSAPILLNNKGAAFYNRAVLNYNKMVQSKDQAERASLRPKINKDFEDAIDSYSQSWMLTKNATPEEISKVSTFQDTKMRTLTGVQDAVRLMVRTESVSEAKKNDVINLMHEYIAFETDQKKKEASQVDLGLYLMRANDFDNSIVEYRKAVQMSPNNPDATGGLGLALWTITYGSEDTARKQEALNYMQYFLDTAPQDHKLRDGIEGGVADLKAQKLKPQKITAKN